MLIRTINATIAEKAYKQHIYISIGKALTGSSKAYHITLSTGDQLSSLHDVVLSYSTLHVAEEDKDIDNVTYEWLIVMVCRETIVRVTGGMKVKADRDEVS